MVSVHELEALKREVEDLKRKTAEARGAIKQIQSELKLTPEEAKEELVLLQGKRVELEEELQAKMSEYRTKYHEHRNNQ